MSYQPDPDEVFFCGHCRRQQRPEQGEKCIMCKRQTVSWYTNRETEADALRKWKYLHGERQ